MQQFYKPQTRKGENFRFEDRVDAIPREKLSRLFCSSITTVCKLVRGAVVAAGRKVGFNVNPWKSVIARYTANAGVLQAAVASIAFHDR